MIKKILIVTNSSWNIYNFRRGLIHAAKKKKYVVSTAAPTDSYARHLNSNYTPIKTKGVFAFFLRDFFLIFQLFKLYRSSKPDVALHYTIKMNIYGTLVAKWYGIPCINTIPGLGSVFVHKNYLTLIVKALYRMSQRFSKKVSFFNLEDKDFFLQNRIVIPSQIEMIPGSGVNTEKFMPIDLQTKSNHSFTFLLSSRMIWDKGIKEYIEAARSILKKNECIKFQIIGFLNCDNPYAIKEKQINEWVKEGVVEFLGETDNVIPYIGESDCIVLPTYYREGIPRSILEALSMEKPVITTDTVGCRDLVDDEVNGLLCKPKDVTDLIDKMQKMIDTPEEERIQMGKNGRKKVIEQYSEKIVVSKYLNIIDEIVNNNCKN